MADDLEAPTVSDISDQLRALVAQTRGLVNEIDEVVDTLHDHAERGVQGDYDRRHADLPHEPERRLEKRVARLERIAEYLHDARKEAADLTVSVDTLSDRTQSLTTRLAAIEDQQREEDRRG